MLKINARKKKKKKNQNIYFYASTKLKQINKKKVVDLQQFAGKKGSRLLVDVSVLHAVAGFLRNPMVRMGKIVCVCVRGAGEK